MPQPRQITLTVTGHRPEKLGGHSDATHQRLLLFAVRMMEVLQPDHVITGGALGWDLAAGQAAEICKIPYTLAIPFPNQPARWPAPHVQAWAKLRAAAAHVETISAEYKSEAFQRRNEWMVDRCDVLLALWNGSLGGTGNCVGYARGKPSPPKIINCWNDFKQWSKTCQ